MKSNFTCKIVALAIAGGVLLSATSALAAADAFDRSVLGTTWHVTSGSLSISNHELVGTTLSLGYLQGASSTNSASAVVFLGGTDLEYGAIGLGNIAAGTNAFVKIQQQDGGGTFDHAAFYTGNNGGGTFFALASPVPSPAILDVFICNTTAHMRITSTAGVQTYTQNYGTTFGPGGGLGTYGSVKLDNFVTFNSNAACTNSPDAVPAIDMPSETDKSHAR